MEPRYMVIDSDEDNDMILSMQYIYIYFYEYEVLYYVNIYYIFILQCIISCIYYIYIKVHMYCAVNL